MTDPLEQGEVQLDVVTSDQVAYAIRQDEPPQTYIREDVVRAQIEAAVKRALEEVSRYHGRFLMVKTSVDVETVVASEEAIRALDPAQFVDGETQ